MESEWQTMSLGKFVRLQRGHDLTAAERKSGPYPVMGSAGQNGTHSEWKMKGPGVVIGRSGASIGRVHFTEDRYWPHNTCLYVTDFLGNDERFTYYFLGSLQLANYNSGSAQPSLNRNYIYSKEIVVPPRAEQIEIANFLGDFDDRIDNLRAANATLEAIAQALFKSWFVDFDPVHAKAEGRAPEGMDAAIAALFPSEFEDSELGPVPTGWRVGQLSDLIELRYGKALKAADRRAGNVPVYGSGGITGSHDTALVPGPTIIVGRKGTVGSLYWESRPCFPIDTVFYVQAHVSIHYCYYAMKRLGLDRLNTDAAVPGLNRTNAYRQAVVIPPREVADAWGNLCTPVRTRIDQAAEYVRLLKLTRNSLLPRLISGKLRLPKAAEADETALA